MKTKYIKNILMCRPTHFSVDYAINPWMKPGSVDQALAMNQWETLVEQLKLQGIQVDYIDQEEGLPDMVFSTDQGITINNKVLLSNFRYPQRKGETIRYKKWFDDNNYSTVTLPNGMYLEGSGDSLFFGDRIFMGYGFRTSKNSAEKIADLLNIEVLALELINPKYYHLDLAFLPLNENSAFYYPKAFSENSQQILRKIIPNLYEFNDVEVNGFAANSLVTDHHVIVQKNIPSFNDRLKELGYKIIETDVSEFLKAGGGIHCLVQVLKEKYE